MFGRQDGGVSPYMMGLILGITIVSSLTANQARLKNAENQDKYIEEKKHYLEDMANSVSKSYVLEQITSSSTGQEEKANKQVFTNVFDVADSLQVKEGTQADGSKTNIITIEKNENKKQKALALADADVLDKDFAGELSTVVYEKSVRENQIATSYKSMKEQAGLMYSDLENSADLKWPCTATLTQKDSWGRDFTYTRIDDANATLSFNLPWDNAKSKVLKLHLPELPVESEEVKDIIFNTFQTSLLLTSTGKVYGAGNNTNKLMGIPDGPYVDTWTDTGLTGVEHIYNASSSTLVVDSNGNFKGAGKNESGELGLGHANQVDTWTDIPLTGIKRVFTDTKGSYYAVGNDGKMIVAGKNQYGTLGVGTKTPVYTWTTLSNGPIDVVEMDFYFNVNVIARTSSGEVWVIGKNFSTGLGVGSGELTTWHQVTNIPVPARKVKLVMDKAALAIGNDNKLYIGGSKYHLGTQNSGREWEYANIDDVKMVINAGDDSLFVIKNNNELWSVGYNARGQLGTGNTTTLDVWTKDTTFPLGLKDILVQERSTYYFSSYAITTDGKLYVTGENNVGQLGIGTTTDAVAWTYVDFPHPVKGVFTDRTNAAASYVLLENGDFYSTGSNRNKAVGSGTSADVLSYFKAPLGKVDMVRYLNSSIIFIKSEDGIVYATGNCTSCEGDGPSSSRAWRETIGPNSTALASSGTVCP